MVKIGTPLMSMSASGKIGQRLVFSQRSSGQQARFQKAQKDVISCPRSTNRFLYSLCSLTWRHLTQGQKDVYIALAKNEKMTGYNYFVKLALADPKTYLNLVGYWSMNEVAGATLPDDSKNANNGTLSPTYPTNCPTVVDSVNEKHCKALSFNGVQNYVTIPHTSLLDTVGSLSISFWCYNRGWHNIGSTFNVILTKGDSLVAEGGLGFGFLVGDVIGFFYNNKRAYSSLSSANKWYHYVGVYNADSQIVQLYRNGVSVGSNSATPLVANVGNLILGKGYTGYTRNFDGDIDNICFFNKNLSSSEIKGLYRKETA